MLISKLLNGVETIYVSCDLDTEISGLTMDSRKAVAGTLFAAVSGGHADGHEYIERAFENGVGVVLCEKPPKKDIPYIQVQNTRRAYAQICANFYGRPAEKMKIVGVTGTNGKSTTTHLIKSMLESAGHKCGLVGTIHYMSGEKAIDASNTTPEADELHRLLKDFYDDGCEYVVMEVSSHSLALDRVYGIRFACGAFTNLTQDHLDFHGDMEHYRSAKGSFFGMCDCSVINLDDATADYMLSCADAKKYTYSTIRDDADLTAKNIRTYILYSEYEALTNEGIVRARINLPGVFNIYNSLAAIGVCLSLGITLPDCGKYIREAGVVKGRAEIVPTDTDFIVMIDYAHTPDGLENILKAARMIASKRLITLFGCGGDRDKTKRPLMGEAAAKYSDYVIVTSDNPRSEHPDSIIEDIKPGVMKMKTPFMCITDRTKAIHYALDNAQSGDLILLAGKGHETYQILSDKTIHFDEREVIKDYLHKKEGIK